MPSAAEIDVELCAVPNVSNSLSVRRGKPEGPPHWRSLDIVRAAAGEDLVRVGLVPDVPHEAVVRRVEHVVQRDRQLDGAEVRREVPARLRHGLQQERAQLARKRRQRFAFQRAKIGGFGDRLEDGEAHRQCVRSVIQSASSTRRRARGPNDASAVNASPRSVAA